MEQWLRSKIWGFYGGDYDDYHLGVISQKMIIIMIKINFYFKHFLYAKYLITYRDDYFRFCEMISIVIRFASAINRHQGQWGYAKHYKFWKFGMYIFKIYLNLYRMSHKMCAKLQEVFN
jgi:hypothetical protein